MNIGDTVNYYNVYNEKVCGAIAEINSNMDSYDEIDLKDGVQIYYSKKLFCFVPVKKKNINSVFITVKTTGRPNEFLSFNELFY